MRTLYATDASAYREMPLAVAIPSTKQDIQKITNLQTIKLASFQSRRYFTSRSVVGGIIVDISRFHPNSIGGQSQ
jgi:hypothetical protein